MNFLSPDDIFTGVRRKSLCNGAIVSLSNGKASTPESSNTIPNKAKKERRRGSFNESNGRRSSLVSRWFKHISDAAEQYKQRSKSNHEVVDDPASATLPHSNTKESLENTPERQTPSSATATATTAVGNPGANNNISDRDYTPEKGLNNFCNNNNALDMGGAYGGEGIDPSRSNNRNESNNNEFISPNSEDDTRAQTQQVHISNIGDEGSSAAISRRDNSSLYSNNSNNTRTLMQNSPLVEPSAIQISISPAHTAEPVLTPSERLKRLDNSIRENLVEKHKIICDMFRLPIEHFNEIVDIVAQPEAPKDSSDIALAAYAQVQSLTEVLNDYMKINSTEQEISAVSTMVCDQCHQTQQQQQNLQSLLQPTTAKRPVSPLIPSATLATLATLATTSCKPRSDETNSTPIVQSPSSKLPIGNTVFTGPSSVDDDQIIHEDDDGYCEIDELRLPSVPIPKSNAAVSSTSGSFKASLPIGVGVEMASRNSSTPDLVKRQSTISTDSIPEESEHDVTKLDEPTLSSSVSISKTTSKGEDGPLPIQFDIRQNSSEACIDQSQPEDSNSIKVKQITDDSLDSEHIEINDNYDTLNLSVIDGNDSTGVHPCQSPGPILCGPNRLLHANSLEPSVPCHVINGIVSTLNSQISLLLPKINERDQERERLRRENQHLRELLNAMHERQRVEANTETPAEITISAETSGETAITAAVAEQSTIEETSFS